MDSFQLNSTVNRTRGQADACARHTRLAQSTAWVLAAARPLRARFDYARAFSQRGIVEVHIVGNHRLRPLSGLPGERPFTHWAAGTPAREGPLVERSRWGGY